MTLLNEISQVHPASISTFLIAVYRMFDNLLKGLGLDILGSFFKTLIFMRLGVLKLVQSVFLVMENSGVHLELDLGELLEFFLKFGEIIQMALREFGLDHG